MYACYKKKNRFQHGFGGTRKRSKRWWTFSTSISKSVRTCHPLQIVCEDVDIDITDKTCMIQSFAHEVNELLQVSGNATMIDLPGHALHDS